MGARSGVKLESMHGSIRGPIRHRFVVERRFGVDSGSVRVRFLSSSGRRRVDGGSISVPLSGSISGRSGSRRVRSRARRYMERALEKLGPAPETPLALLRAPPERAVETHASTHAALWVVLGSLGMSGLVRNLDQAMRSAPPPPPVKWVSGHQNLVLPACRAHSRSPAAPKITVFQKFPHIAKSQRSGKSLAPSSPSEHAPQSRAFLFGFAQMRKFLTLRSVVRATHQELPQQNRGNRVFRRRAPARRAPALGGIRVTRTPAAQGGCGSGGGCIGTWHRPTLAIVMNVNAVQSLRRGLATTEEGPTMRRMIVPAHAEVAHGRALLEARVFDRIAGSLYHAGGGVCSSARWGWQTGPRQARTPGPPPPRQRGNGAHQPADGRTCVRSPLAFVAVIFSVVQFLGCSDPPCSAPTYTSWSHIEPWFAEAFAALLEQGFEGFGQLRAPIPRHHVLTLSPGARFGLKIGRGQRVLRADGPMWALCARLRAGVPGGGGAPARSMPRGGCRRHSVVVQPGGGVCPRQARPGPSVRVDHKTLPNDALWEKCVRSGSAYAVV